MRGPLKLLVLLTAGVLSLGVWLRWAPGPDLGSAVEQLVDGDLDHAARQACLRLVVATGRRGAAEGDLQAGVLAAMAALELGDRPGYEQVAALLRGRSPWLPGCTEPASPDVPVGDLSLGQPYLRSLLLAQQAENRADRAAASRQFTLARNSARLYGAGEVARLAAEGLERSR